MCTTLCTVKYIAVHALTMASLQSVLEMIDISMRVWEQNGLTLNLLQLLAHDAHLDPPQFMEGMNCVKVITCPFPQAQVRERNVVKLDHNGYPPLGCIQESAFCSSRI
jgi:hypothetical protein